MRLTESHSSWVQPPCFPLMDSSEDGKEPHPQGRGSAEAKVHPPQVSMEPYVPCIDGHSQFCMDTDASYPGSFSFDTASHYDGFCPECCSNAGLFMHDGQLQLDISNLLKSGISTANQQGTTSCDDEVQLCLMYMPTFPCEDKSETKTQCSNTRSGNMPLAAKECMPEAPPIASYCPSSIQTSGLNSGHKTRKLERRAQRSHVQRSGSEHCSPDVQKNTGKMMRSLLMDCTENYQWDDASVLCGAQDNQQSHYNQPGQPRECIAKVHEHMPQKGPEDLTADQAPPCHFGAGWEVSTLLSRGKLQRLNPMGPVDILNDFLVDEPTEGDPQSSDHISPLYKQQRNTRLSTEQCFSQMHSRFREELPMQLCRPKPFCGANLNVQLDADLLLNTLFSDDGPQTDFMGTEAVQQASGSISTCATHNPRQCTLSSSPKLSTNLVCDESLPQALMTAGLAPASADALYDSLSYQWFDFGPSDERFDLRVTHKDIQTANAYLSKAKLPGRASGSHVEYIPVSPDLLLCEIGLKWEFSGSIICLAQSYLLRLDIQGVTMHRKNSDIDALCICLSLASQVCDPSCIARLVEMLQWSQERKVEPQEACNLLFQYSFRLDFRLGPYFTIQ